MIEILGISLVCIGVGAWAGLALRSVWAQFRSPMMNEDDEFYGENIDHR